MQVPIFISTLDVRDTAQIQALPEKLPDEFKEVPPPPPLPLFSLAPCGLPQAPVEGGISHVGNICCAHSIGNTDRILGLRQRKQSARPYTSQAQCSDRSEERTVELASKIQAMVEVLTGRVCMYVRPVGWSAVLPAGNRADFCDEGLGLASGRHTSQ